LSWLDWRLYDANADLHRFVKMLTRFRQQRDVVLEQFNLTGLTLNQLLAEAQIKWHGVKLDAPDWGDDSHSIAFTLRSMLEHFTMHAMLNAYWQPLTFELPLAYKWRRWIDTSLASPDDVTAWTEAPLVAQPQYKVEPRSVVFLVDSGT